MSTPQAKRRRLNDAAKTLHKPFKSPFRTPLKPNIGSDLPSSDPPEPSTAAATCSDDAIHGEPGSIAHALPTGGLSKACLATAAQTLRHPPLHASATAIVQGSKMQKAQSKPSVAREIMRLRNEIQLLKQAHTLATSTKDDDLIILIDRWRAASRAAVEELFGSTRDRVNRMGGVGAWQQREKESKERRLKWDQDELQAERERMEEARENGEVSDEAYDRYAELCEESVEETEPVAQAADDDSFTMDMMLKTLNIDLDLIGYNKEAQRWDG